MVWPGRYVWRLAMDVVVLRCDGCVLDACSIAMREALRETKLPMVRAVLGRDDGGGGGGALGSLGGKENDLTVDGDVKNAVSPSGAEECPLVVTVSVLSAPASATGAITSSASKRNRSISIIDARTEEEACASSRVCVSVDPSGMVCGVHTLGGGGVALDQGTDGGGGVEENGGGSSMPLAMLGEIVTTAAMASKNLYALLDDEDESTNMKKRSQRSTSGEDDGSGYGYLLRNHFLIQ